MLKEEDLRENSIYYYECIYDNDFIFRSKGSSRSSGYIEDNKVFYKSGGSFSQLHTARKLREATPEQKHWLECCEKAGKFITKEEALKSFNKPKEDAYKYFVKCNNQKEWDFVLKQTGYTYVFC